MLRGERLLKINLFIEEEDENVYREIVVNKKKPYIDWSDDHFYYIDKNKTYFRRNALIVFLCLYIQMYTFHILYVWSRVWSNNKNKSNK